MVRSSPVLRSTTGEVAARRADGGGMGPQPLANTPQAIRAPLLPDGSVL